MLERFKEALRHLRISKLAKQCGGNPFMCLRLVSLYPAKQMISGYVSYDTCDLWMNIQDMAAFLFLFF